MELWLIRHPRPLVAPDICYGRLDLRVAEPEAHAAAERLSRRLDGVDRLRSSPARRCLALARRLHEDPAADDRLHERSFGDWEGLSWEAIGRAAVDAWAADPWDFLPPGGESARMVRERVAALLAEEVSRGGTVAWVTHQGVARAVAGLLLDMPAAEWMSLRLDFGEAWRFVGAGTDWKLERE